MKEEKASDMSLIYKKKMRLLRSGSKTSEVALLWNEFLM
jgi:hypothetical protein